MIKRAIQTEERQNSVTITIDRNQPPVVIIVFSASTCNNEIQEPQDTGNLLTGIDYILSEIKLDPDYDLKIKELKLELEEFSTLKNIIDLEP